jgi:hypothetical protein
MMESWARPDSLRTPYHCEKYSIPGVQPLKSRAGWGQLHYSLLTLVLDKALVPGYMGRQTKAKLWGCFVHQAQKTWTVTGNYSGY